MDESGDHAASSDGAIGKRYLGLTGVMMKQGEPYKAFAKRLDNLKGSHLPEHEVDSPVILHRSDICNATGPFKPLRVAEARSRFDADLLGLIAETEFTLITIVIDKSTHFKASYRSLKHPYHYCLTVLLERYCGYLDRLGLGGDVLAESRGGTEDQGLREAYTTVLENGTRFHPSGFFQGALSSRELKIKKKDRNIAGLQLADLLAHPMMRHVLRIHNRTDTISGRQASQIVDLCRDRYYHPGVPISANFAKVLLT